jgi:hypothetical protein
MNCTLKILLCSLVSEYFSVLDLTKHWVSYFSEATVEPRFKVCLENKSFFNLNSRNFVNVKFKQKVKPFFISNANGATHLRLENCLFLDKVQCQLTCDFWAHLQNTFGETTLIKYFPVLHWSPSLNVLHILFPFQ